MNLNENFKNQSQKVDIHVELKILRVLDRLHKLRTYIFSLQNLHDV